MRISLKGQEKVLAAQNDLDATRRGGALENDMQEQDEKHVDTWA